MSIEDIHSTLRKSIEERIFYLNSHPEEVRELNAKIKYESTRNNAGYSMAQREALTQEDTSGRRYTG